MVVGAIQLGAMNHNWQSPLSTRRVRARMIHLLWSDYDRLHYFLNKIFPPYSAVCILMIMSTIYLVFHRVHSVYTIPFCPVCAPPSEYRTMLCTIDLRCAPPTCVVHYGAQGGPVSIRCGNCMVRICFPFELYKNNGPLSCVGITFFLVLSLYLARTQLLSIQFT